MNDDLTLIEFFKRFPDDAAAERWFVERRWPNGITCPHCQSAIVETKAKHPTMPYRCADCGKYFSVKVGSIMHSSKLSYQKWALALYLLTTSKKGISSADLAEKLGISRKAAWHLSHRIRQTFEADAATFNGTVEADETYVGGTDRARHRNRKGRIPKTPVIGIKERETGRVRTAIMPNVVGRDVRSFLHENVSPDATLYTDGAPFYKATQVAEHAAVNHADGEYVRGQVHTNGIESHWALLDRGFVGIYHWWSRKHFHRYLREFAGRFNSRDKSTAERLDAMADRMPGHRLPYAELTSE